MISKSIEYVRGRIQNAHPRTRKAQLNTFLGLVVKGGGMLISLLLVPLTIDYLSKEVYGTWLTISSIVMMLTFLDIGIGNGLRNKFSEAVTNNDTGLARAYVSTAYFIFGIIQTVFILMFIIFFRFIPWQRIFNTNIDTEELQLVILITVVAIALKLVLDILSYILFALQESGWVGLINLISNTLILVGTYLLTRFTNGNLIYLATITLVLPVLVMVISGFVLYKHQLKAYRPSFSLVDFKQAKSLLSLGYKFFFIQISAIVLFYTDNLIITQLFGPSEVTTYNVAFRYFNSITTVFTIFTTPYWSAFTEASVKGDIEWIKRTHNHLQKLWLGLIILVIMMVIIAEPVYQLWVGGRVVVPLELNIFMGIFCIITSWNNIAASVINGLGKVKLQLYYALLASFINVPLAILLGQKLEMGSAGVILATSLSLLVCSVFGGIQVKRIISGRAEGIWNQ